MEGERTQCPLFRGSINKRQTNLFVCSHIGGKVRVQWYMNDSHIKVARSFLKRWMDGLRSHLRTGREREGGGGGGGGT